MRQTRNITGTLYDAYGRMTGKVTQHLTVLVSPMGVAYDPISGDELMTEREEIAKGVHVDIIHAGTTLWRFQANEGECERAEIVVNHAA